MFEADPVHVSEPQARPLSSAGPPPSLEGADGAKVSFVDVEWGWAAHEALPPVERVFGVPRGWWWHGNGVLGVIVGQGPRIRGIAPRARAMVASPWTADGRYEVASALEAACDRLGPGDVLLIELQSSLGERTGLPAEIDPEVADRLALAHRRGILVIEAAGNGGWELDRIAVAGRGPIGGSGALLVGAGSRASPERMPRSCWGSAVGCWAWGEEVETAWSNHLGTATDAYNPSFCGTSAAAAIVAGIAIAVQSAARARGTTILPDAMKALLTAHGAAIPGIGVMPDPGAILSALSSDPTLSAARR